jgi:hypothetical protein
MRKANNQTFDKPQEDRIPTFGEIKLTEVLMFYFIDPFSLGQGKITDIIEEKWENLRLR